MKHLSLILLLCFIGSSFAHAVPGQADRKLSAPDLAAFDPDAVAALEARMWRDYYDENWLHLGSSLLELARGQFGFSAEDSARMAFSAGQAAMHFRNDADDPRCLDYLKQFYGVIRSSTGSAFSVEKAAELELSWWRKRREAAAPSDIAADIAALTERLMELPQDAALPAAIIRVEAMEYRDARRDGKMTEQDWTHVETRLHAAYRMLRHSIDEHK